MPVELASDKQEHAARTLRPKIREHLEDFLVELEPTDVGKQSTNVKDDGLDLSEVEEILDGMDLDRSVEPLRHLFKGGTVEAKSILEDFIKNRFGTYVEHRNQPQTDDVSHMSKYLHYGYVSPVYVTLEIRRGGKGRENIDSYIEELIECREPSINFCHYAPITTPSPACPAGRRRLSGSTPGTNASASMPASSKRMQRRTTSTGTRR